MPDKVSLKKILADHRDLWDNLSTRPVVRKNFQKVLDCRTPALGAEVYGSDNGERKLVPHTCKSRACSSCGQRRTLCWQLEVASGLPDVPTARVGFTMHSDFWPIFQQNRHLLNDLPALGAAVLQDWAEKKYGAQVMVLVVCHTFGADLAFKPHLHMLVSTVGLHEAGNELVWGIRFPRDAVMRIWRHSLLEYLTMALKAGRLSADLAKPKLIELFQNHHDRWWSAEVAYCQSKDAFLLYISRYLRRPPLAAHRLLSADGQAVRFLTKDKKKKRTVVTTCTSREFIARLADQVPDRYRHGVRYFGLLAPRSISKSYEVFLALLGQRMRSRPKRIGWRASILSSFKWDPLLDSDGRTMYRVGRVSPVKPDTT